MRDNAPIKASFPLPAEVDPVRRRDEQRARIMWAPGGKWCKDTREDWQR